MSNLLEKSYLLISNVTSQKVSTKNIDIYMYVYIFRRLSKRQIAISKHMLNLFLMPATERHCRNAIDMMVSNLALALLSNLHYDDNLPV